MSNEYFLMGCETLNNEYIRALILSLLLQYEKLLLLNYNNDNDNK